MDATNMQFKVTPACRRVVTGRIRTIGAQQNQGVLHHLFSLKRYRQLFIFVRNTLWSVGREGCVRGDGKDDRRLWFLAFVG